MKEIFEVITNHLNFFKSTGLCVPLRFESELESLGIYDLEKFLDSFSNYSNDEWYDFKQTVVDGLEYEREKALEESGQRQLEDPHDECDWPNQWGKKSDINDHEPNFDRDQTISEAYGRDLILDKNKVTCEESDEEFHGRQYFKSIITDLTE